MQQTTRNGTEISPQFLDEITRRIVDRFHPRRVIVFGSQARGDTRRGSDVDLFVEMETDRRPPERAAEVAAVFGLRPWSFDVVVYTPEEVERMRLIGGTLLHRIEQEGRVVYERA